jgi:mono/diheme cytochrome c family protein
MKSKLLVVIALIGILMFVVACGSSAEADTTDQHADEDDPTHNPDDHMAGAHNVPEEAATVPNPISATDESVATGGTLFATNCAVCHGVKGRGDGPAAEAMEPKPADLMEGHVQGLSDGALFYIITHGKPDTPMPAWEDVLEKDDRWNVVNFMRALADELEDGEHMEGDEHTEDQHEEDEHTEDEHMEGDEHTEDQHEEDEHTEDEHSD